MMVMIVPQRTTAKEESEEESQHTHTFNHRCLSGAKSEYAGLCKPEESTDSRAVCVFDDKTFYVAAAKKGTQFVMLFCPPNSK